MYKPIALKETHIKVISVLTESISGLRAIYHFGSTASTTETPNSDIDLAFLAQNKVDDIERWNIQEELASVFCRDVDLIDLQSASDVMKFQIISTGQRIHEINVNEIEHFETLVYSMYLDLNEQRKELLKDFETSGTVYG